MPDALWARVVAVLETVDPAPPANARALLEALVYLAITGCCGDDLPDIYPPAAEVEAAAARWRELGFFEGLESILLISLDE
jgi:hypothetical protein